MFDIWAELILTLNKNQVLNFTDILQLIRVTLLDLSVNWNNCLKTND